MFPLLWLDTASKSVPRMPTGVNELKRKLYVKRRMFIALLAVFIAVGVYSLVVGVWLYLERNSFSELAPSSFSVAVTACDSALSTAGLCIATGVAVFIISAVGWMGAVAYNRRLLITYIGFVLFLASIQTVTGVLGFCYKNATREHVRVDLLNSINHTASANGRGDVFDLAASWDKLQKSLECCGVDDASDWYYSVRWPSQEYVPDSCCDPTYFFAVESTSNCGKLNNITLTFQQGCIDVFSEWLFHHVTVMNWISFALLIIEITSLAFVIPVAKTSSFIVGAHGMSRDDYHRCLVEMQEIENYLREHAMQESYPCENTVDVNNGDHEGPLGSVL